MKPFFIFALAVIVLVTLGVYLAIFSKIYTLKNTEAAHKFFPMPKAEEPYYPPHPYDEGMPLHDKG